MVSIAGKGISEVPDNRVLFAVLFPVLFPYVLLRVVLYLAILLPALVIVTLLLLVKILAALPKALVRTAASRTSVVAGTLLPATDADRAFDEQAQPAAKLAADLALLFDDDGDGIEEVSDRGAALWELWHGSIVTGNADSVRPFVTEGFWRLHRMLIDLRVDNGVERVFDAEVTGRTLVGLTRSEIIDEITIDLRCQGRYFDRWRTARTVVRGSDQPDRWREQLTLRRNTHSYHERGDVGGCRLPSTCFNCGDAVNVSDIGTCATCGALVAARAGDWVLSSAWRARW